jgi:alpha-tubulin suppressor-like RCC1 family protein
MRQLSVTLAIGVALLAAGACSEDNAGPESEATAQPALATAAVPLSFRQISAGSFRSCGITQDNRIFCWGTSKGFFGGALRFRLVSVGGDHACAVTTDDLAYCWGANFSGQLGDGTTTSRTAPVAVLGGRSWKLVRAGGFHTCGVTLSNQGFCWGSNTQGQLGDGTDLNRRQRPVPVVGALSWRQIIAGISTTCGVTTGNKGYCWGNGSDGQVGDGTTVQERHTPRAVAGGLSFRQVAAGGIQSCGVTQDDRAFCWGGNSEGQIGDGTHTRRLKPVRVAGGLPFSLISPGQVHTCAATSADRAYCWGDNTSGQLGDGTTTNRSVPVAVAGGLHIDLVSAGSGAGGASHSCGLTTGDKAYCWGWNMFGQLGDGTTDDSSTPVPVAGPS